MLGRYTQGSSYTLLHKNAMEIADFFAQSPQASLASIKTHDLRNASTAGLLGSTPLVVP